MLESIKGKILKKMEGRITVDVNGFGLMVNTPLKNDSFNPGDEILLHTYLSITKNGVELYGFKEHEGRELFKTIIKVPNVGPKTALSIISGLGFPGIKKALSNNDPEPISRVKGIGSKTAKRIILELKDSLQLTIKKKGDEARKALMKLGFLSEEANRCIERVLKEKEDLSSNEIVERVLKGT
ncbi:Holliday junction branch migration protein RuvA [candidate division WOR-3 bacterium]|jgi:Holliday junction DNA helicase RuvA|nr:Holliday junction branch migration protein RuvA [candidate division WOR-3 bacterium]